METWPSPPEPWERGRPAQKWTLRAGDVDSKTGLDVHLSPSHTPHRWAVCVCVRVHARADWDSVPAYAWGLSVSLCHASVLLEEGVTLGECMSVQHLSLCELVCLLAHMQEATWVSLGWVGRVSLGCRACVHFRIGGRCVSARQVRTCLSQVKGLLLLLPALCRGPEWMSRCASGCVGGCPLRPRPVCLCWGVGVCQGVSCLCVSLTVTEFGGLS